MEQKFGVIYIATNIANGKQYVGQTVRHFKTRQKEHLNSSSSPLFRLSLEKYGIENFKWVSFSCPEEDLDWQESFLIKELNTTKPNGYNLESGGNINKHHHETTKEKIRDKAKLRWANQEERKKQSKRNKEYMKNHPEEIIKVIERNKQRVGEKHPWFGKTRPEHSKKMKGINNPNFGKRGNNHPAFGRKHTPEEIEKMKSYWKQKKNER